MAELNLGPTGFDLVRGLLATWETPAAVIGRDYRIVAANPAYRRSFEGAIEGERCHAVTHGSAVPCHLAGEQCPIRRSETSGEPQSIVHVHHAAHGSVHEEVRVWPLHDGRGRVEAFLEVLRPIREESVAPVLGRIVGDSASLRHALALVRKVAPSTSSVLIRGESGTGKELLARAVHELSARSAGAFVPVDCSGLAETLFESELFGHEKGAFTGATVLKRGLVEAARGGTLFLDEVGDVPLPLQVKLLRLLETGTYRRVGSTELRHSDFRLVCATHRDLEAQVETGAFREDLYYRIAVFPVFLPPLRERREDIPPLVDALLARIDPRRGLRIREDALAQLLELPLPGNARELLNHLERASILTDGDRILPCHLPSISDLSSSPVGTLPPDLASEEIVPLEEIERRYLAWCAATHGGDRRSLAGKLGVSERTLYRKLRDALATEGADA